MTRIHMISVAVAATLALAACEPVAPDTPGSNIPTGPYVLVGVGADTVPERNVGMTINADGSITGQGPCNSYAATQTAEPPAFGISALTTSRAGCGGRAGRLERRYFEALQGANGISFEGGVLTIMGPTYLTYEPGYRKE